MALHFLVLSLLMLGLVPTITLAFVPATSSSAMMIPERQTAVPTSSMSITAAFRTAGRGMVKCDCDEQQWISESQDEQVGYGILNTLVRHGPTPALRRIFQPQQYEQAVLKFMAEENCSRDEAQGNMDFYIRNPNDWIALRLEQERSGIKVHLVTVNPIRLVLVVVWTGLLMLFVQQFLARVESGEIDFVSPLRSMAKLVSFCRRSGFRVWRQCLGCVLIVFLTSSHSLIFRLCLLSKSLHHVFACC
mgnify:CR=1 FL=1